MSDLSRFVSAQEGVYDQALSELERGSKTSHWMWFIFPQLRSLARSDTSKRYGIADLDEARAYLDHPVLAPRLLTCARAMLEHRGRPASEILGGVDAMKLRSCATLYREAGGAPEFAQILDVFYDGAPCPLTMAELGGRA